MSRRVCSDSTSTEQRVRLSRGSVLLHTSHWHPITGTPHDVPVPKNVNLITLNYELLTLNS